jgi:hypothetical protein
VAQPQEQRTIHKRESASIAANQRCGTTAAKNLCMELIAILSLLFLTLHVGKL